MDDGMLVRCRTPSDPRHPVGRELLSSYVLTLQRGGQRGHHRLRAARVVVRHNRPGIGVAVDVVALATGVGASADASILGIEAEGLGALSTSAGKVGGLSDLPGCVSRSIGRCIGGPDFGRSTGRRVNALVCG